MVFNAFGIDLGTNNIKIYSKSHDAILCEKNLIAIENRKRVFAYGDSAYEMYEKAPANIQVSFPLSRGVIADIHNMETLVHYFIGDMQRGSFKAADFYVAVPTDVTEVEKRAFYDLIKDASVKAKKIMVVEKAIGMDIDVKNSQGILLVNVGYETTEISLLSMGGIVLSKLLKTGGLKLDESIRAAVRKEYNLLIGLKTAEAVKMELATLEAENRNALVYGRDIVTGLPVEREIPIKLVNDSFEEHFNAIIDNVKVILERTPPELGADIYRHGIYLTGGASQVNHFAERLMDGTGLKVNVAEYPMTSVVLGLAKIMKDSHYKSVAYSIEGMSR